MKRNNKKGFTLVELVIVIAVIAILIAVLVPTFASVINKANISADTQEAGNLRTAIALELPKEVTIDNNKVTVSSFDELLEKLNAATAKDNAAINTIFTELNPSLVADSLKGQHGEFSVGTDAEKGDYLSYTSDRKNTVKIYVNEIVVS